MSLPILLRASLVRCNYKIAGTAAPNSMALSLKRVSRPPFSRLDVFMGCEVPWFRLRGEVLTAVCACDDVPAGRDCRAERKVTPNK
jgi:hypothetical protein